MSDTPVTNEAPAREASSTTKRTQEQSAPAPRRASRRKAVEAASDEAVEASRSTARRARKTKAEAAESAKPTAKRARKASKSEKGLSDQPASATVESAPVEVKVPAFARNIPGYAESIAAKASRKAAQQGQSRGAADSSESEQPAVAPASSDAKEGAKRSSEGDSEKPSRGRRRSRRGEADVEREKGRDGAVVDSTKAEDRAASRRATRKSEKEKAEEASSQRARSSSRPSRQERSGQERSRQGEHGKQRQRRQHQERREAKPSVSRDDLSALKVAELRSKAAELGVPFAGLKKAELVEAVYTASMEAEGFIEVEGILDVMSDGYGFVRTSGYLPGDNDAYISTSQVRRIGLRKGDLVRGQLRPKRDNEKFAAMQTVISVNGTPADQLGTRVRFADLTPVFPDDRMVMEHGKNAITARVIDLTAPIGKGQRGLIVSPPKAGKTTILKDIAAAITANNPEIHLMCLLVDERPEEVTDMQRSIRGEVISSTFDMPCENHIAVAEMVIERAKRLVECGQDVVILLDSLTRLARAYNLAQPASGRILSGGVDSTALYPPKRFLGAARNIEGGGSLTILASALIDTGSKMDEVIFEEFKGTGNMELKLDRNLADRRIFPAIDPVQSGTRKEDLLLDPQEAPLIWAVRRILSNMNSTERAMDMLIKSLKQTDNNEEFLIRTAKKAQGHHGGEGFAL